MVSSSSLLFLPKRRKVTSNVPPPKSKMSTFLFSLLLFCNPYAMAAAVGSLMIRSTFNPAIIPAFLVACL